MSAVSIIVVTYMTQIEGESFPLVVYAGPFVLWIVFFMLGIYFSKHSRNYSLTIPVAIATSGFVASILESMYYIPISGSGLGIKLSSFVYSAGVIILLFSRKIENAFNLNPVTRVILFIGEISFAIYFIHVCVIVAVNHFFGQNIWIINWLITLIMTVLFIACCKRFLPTGLSRKYLGIR